MFIPSAYWKRLAREALRNRWLTALLIMLIVNLPSLLVQGIAAVTGNDLMTRLQDAVYGAISASGTAMDEERLISSLRQLSDTSGIWVMQGLNAAAWLLTPCLSLGMTAWMLGRLRKQEDPGVTGVFSRMNLFWKGIGLRLYVAWRIFLFMLPGVAASMLSLLPLWLSDTGSRISALSAVNTSMGLQSAAIILMLVLGVIAALKYTFSDMYLADHPEMGPVQAAKRSKEMTRGRKGQVFLLYTSFILWYLLETFAANLCLSMFGSVPALMVQMLGSLAISAYLQCSLSAFYMGSEAPERPDGEEIPVDANPQGMEGEMGE